MIVLIASAIAAAPVVTAVDAERAFIRDSHSEGQWTAFRKYADGRAVMFTPGPVWAQEFLRGRKDPAKSIDWAPAESWVSCDGKVAINRGPWRNGNAHGYFTTVWLQGGGNWRWVYDGGADLVVPIAFPDQPRVKQASCAGRAKIRAADRGRFSPASRAAGQAPPKTGSGSSDDGTLTYEWKVASDGARHFSARLWDGKAYRVILDQNVPAPAR